MPVVRDITLHLNKEEVLRRQGLSGKRAVQPKVRRLIDELLAGLEEDNLLQAAFAGELIPIIEMDDGGIVLEGRRHVCGPALPAFFPEAVMLAVVVCTIGPVLEERVGALSRSGQPLRALLLDGIGSAAVDALVAEAMQGVAAGAAAGGWQSGSPVNPGMPGFPLTEQRNLLELARADRIGVALSPSGVLIPRKSVAMAAGVGTGMAVWTQSEVCARCCMGQTCQYRKVA